ncbi:GyrI-like domain-containing protein [Dickeya fangzhongdai]|uniref:GyrI-like domain-containing protein n=1 Tax=Dickeya fangzhongdai TaxID=1778540 RepID=UPI001ADBC20B|nr:GyrI-like domain-containing protein [Dickeya fangzhongdai]MBO8134147.1 GyrI-like domain-containing protein [Dickeya fangzhongdai]
MTLRFDVAQPKKVHCLRVIGPYHQSVPDGFQKLIAWAQEQQLPWTETLAFYWDDPSETEQDQLRADVALVLPAETAIGENTLGVREETIPEGLFAVLHTIVSNGEFAKAWGELYDQIAQNGYRPARGVCFERYLCDGSSGNWEIESWQSVDPNDDAQQ